jgi:hypothetical protein
VHKRKEDRDGYWEIWVPNELMDMDIFGEMLYVTPCATQGIQFMAGITDQTRQAITTRWEFGLTDSDDMVDALHKTLSWTIRAIPRTKQVGCILSSPASVHHFFSTAEHSRSI